MGELVFATVLDGIATFILFTIWHARREIRGRLLPLWILTSVHTLLSLFVCFNFCEPVADVLGDLFSWAIPVLFLFGIIYLIALSEHSRMTRHLGLSCFLFAANWLVQGLLFLAFFIRGQAG